MSEVQVKKCNHIEGSRAKSGMYFAIVLLGLFFNPGMVLAADTSTRQSMQSDAETAVWPYASWSTAKAYTFNQFRMRPNTSLLVYGDKGWSKHITSQQPILTEQADEAVQLARQSKGSMYVSKCPFPRHAVVLFNTENKPVASINICFECGDILIWPEVNKTKSEHADLYQKVDPKTGEPAFLKIYDQVYPKWERFFSEKLKMKITDKYRPR